MRAAGIDERRLWHRERETDSFKVVISARVLPLRARSLSLSFPFLSHPFLQLDFFPPLDKQRSSSSSRRRRRRRRKNHSSRLRLILDRCIASHKFCLSFFPPFLSFFFQSFEYRTRRARTMIDRPKQPAKYI